MKILKGASSKATRLVAAALISLTAAGAAQAQAAYFSGPSIGRASELATFSGGNFKPNTAVTVVVAAPSGAESSYGAVAGADGKLSFQFAPLVKGSYALKVTGSDGSVLAKATLVANL